MLVFNSATFAACLLLLAQSRSATEVGTFRLGSEGTLDPTEEIPGAGGATIAGLPAVPCGQTTYPQNLWRFGCRNDKAGGQLIAFPEGVGAPIVLASGFGKLLMVASVGLHDHIVIRTLSQKADGQMVWAEHLWKPRY